MLLADRLIALALMGLSIYFMVHATVLPIGWTEESGPGGGAFPFWLSAIMLAASAGIFLRSLRSGIQLAGPFFDTDTIRSVALVIIALIITIGLVPVLGTYIALPMFLFWYLRIYGRQSLKVSLSITVLTPVFLFFFFEVALKILLPKGMTEPLFIHLYAIFF